VSPAAVCRSRPARVRPVGLARRSGGCRAFVSSCCPAPRAPTTAAPWRASCTELAARYSPGARVQARATARVSVNVANTRAGACGLCSAQCRLARFRCVVFEWPACGPGAISLLMLHATLLLFFFLASSYHIIHSARVPPLAVACVACCLGGRRYIELYSIVVYRIKKIEC
jgi:hypothetical protein